MTKKEWRAMMKRRNLALAGDVRRRMSEQLIGRIGELPEFAAARCVGLFCALPDEPDMTAALAAWSCGKRVVVPRVEGETMQFYDYDRATMVCGAFGIAEPGAGARMCRPEEIELVVVPGVAFDRCGARLGRGKGFYDRYLSQSGVRAVKIGACYAHQLVEALPVEPHDVRMDRVVCVGE